MDYIIGLNNLNGDIIEEYSNFNSINDKLNVNKSKFNSTSKLRKRSKLRKIVDNQFYDIKDWILNLSNINLSEYGISKKVLYRTKRSIKEGKIQMIHKNTKLKFINYSNYLSKNQSTLSTISTQHAIADCNPSTKEVIAA